MQTIRITDELPDLSTLRAEARAEGYRHMERLADEWESGAQRFDKPGEALFAVFMEGEVAGIGGVTREPNEPDGAVLRARRLYVRPAYRKLGVGRAIAGAIVQEAFDEAPALYVNVSAGGSDSQAASVFWERMGFERVDGVAGISHRLMR
ncbi:MAG: GNAT family N-acetyltransferase [Hyphomonadaceae bacterium]